MPKMEHQIGSLTPGKQADLMLVDATAINMQPCLSLLESSGQRILEAMNLH